MWSGVLVGVLKAGVVEMRAEHVETESSQRNSGR
jgi:hypothetical protein